VLAYQPSFPADLEANAGAVNRLIGYKDEFAGKKPVEVAKLLQGYRQVRAGKVPFYVLAKPAGDEQSTLMTAFVRNMRSCVKSDYKQAKPNDRGFSDIRSKQGNRMVMSVPPADNVHMTLAPLDASAAELDAFTTYDANDGLQDELRA